jgi:DNA helicase-2/ATP-dependent DNA helicase PcrA
MVEDGVDPQKIIFFSFTNDAVDELKRRIKHDVKITTIHSFTASLLGKMGRFKKIATFYDFVNWYKEKYRPDNRASRERKDEFQQLMTFFYEEGNQVSASFSAYKLQTSDGFKLPKPEHYVEYEKFLKDTKSRDFSDMLIDTEKLSRDPKYKQYFEGIYDHIFIDEYQDTSTLQLKILLTIKAKQYYLIGDENQSIYGFSGANCEMIEQLLIKNHNTIRMTLTKNFRSDKKIVEHANKFSKITAVAHSENDGSIKYDLIDMFHLADMIKDDKPLAILVRTNNIIKDMEEYCLKNKLKIRYGNYITKDEIRRIKENDINQSLRKRLDKIIPYYTSQEKLLKFIEDNNESMNFITSIHKSKGREFPRCVIVNSLDPELAEKHGIGDDYTYLTKDGDIDQEERNVHYVAVTRPMHEVYFMIF